MGMNVVLVPLNMILIHKIERVDKLHLNTLEKIVKNIEKSNMHHCGPGLLTGKSGIALLLFYYSRLTNNKSYSTKGANLIVNVFSAIKQGYNFPTFCDGLAGFAWTVEHLVENGF